MSSLILSIVKSTPFQYEEGFGVMMITNKTLPRRTFLRGLGATMALPLLDSMFPPSRLARRRGRARNRRSGSVTCTRRTASSGATTRAPGSSCGRRPPPAPTSRSAPR